MFIRHVFYTLSVEVATVAVNFLTGILLARGLPLAERGVMALVMTLPWLIASLADLGLPQANIYWIGRKKLPVGTVLGVSLWLGIILGGLAFLVFFVFRDLLLTTVLKDLPPDYLAPLLTLALLLVVDGVLLSIMRARQQFGLLSLRRLAAPVLLLAGFGMTLWIAPGSLDGLVRVYVGVTAALVGVSLVMVERVVPAKPIWNGALASQLLRFGSKSYLHSLLGVLHYRLDIYLVAFFLSPEHIAVYAVATSLAEVAWYIPDSVGLVLFPRLAHAAEPDVHQITARVSRQTLALTLAVSAGMLGFSWLLLPWLYGPAYQASVVPLAVLLAGIASMSVFKILSRNFTSRDRQQVPVLVSGLALVLNLGLNLLLIPRWGVVGAAAASSVSYTVAGLLLVVFFRAESGLPWKEVLIPTRGELAQFFRYPRQAGKWLAANSK